MIIEPCNDDLLQRGRSNSWNQAAEERLVPEAWPLIRPSFQIPRGGRIFTIGSCFARNIEENLHQLGYSIPTLDYSVPHIERGQARPNHGLIKLTPADIQQEIAWAERIYARDGRPVLKDFEAFGYTEPQDRVRDLALSTPWGVARTVSQERFEKRRQQLFDIWKQVFDAHCVVITLGLIEAWFDRRNGTYSVHAPGFVRNADELSRFELRVLDFQDCLDLVRSSLELIRRHNPDVKFLVTTSPIPMANSYSGNDVLISNTESKATLRAVCGALARDESVDYFPSFESVTLTRDWKIWSSDRRHVSEGFVGKIVGQLAATYFDSAKQSRKLLQQASTALVENEGHKALKFATQATEIDETLADAWLIRAQVCQRLGLDSEALEYAERCLGLARDCAPAVRVLIEIRLDTGALDGLIETARNLVALAPESPDSHYLLGRVLWKEGDLPGARSAFEAAAGTYPQWLTFRRKLVSFLRETGQLEDALSLQSTRVNDAPEDLEDRLELCRCLLAAKRVPEALTHAEIACTLDDLPRLQLQLEQLVAEIGRALD